MARRPSLLILGLVLAACGRGDESRQTAGSSAMAAPAVATTGTTTATGGTPACPPTGLWTACAVMQRLDRSGLAPRADSGTVSIAPFSVAARKLHLGTSDLDVVIYPDIAARERDEKKLDRAAFVEYDAPLGLKPLPTLIRSANLIAVLHSRNDHQRERVSDALTAGPPQP